MSNKWLAAPTPLGAWCVAALCAGHGAGIAYAAEPYPQRPVRVVVQFSPGGNVDTAARVISRQLAQQMNQQFVIDNRPGASGSIAYQTLATAAPDGYTLGIGHIGHLALNPHTLGKVPYDPLKDFTAIGRMADAPNLLVSNPSLPVKTVQDLVAYAKAHPGKVASGTGGVGTVGHLAVELLSQRAGISLLHVPYKGSSQVVTDLISGGVQISFGGPPSLLPHVKSGKLRALAITSLKRAPSLDLPTVAEAGYPGFEAVAWMGLIAPAGLRKEIVERLNRELRESLKADEVRRILDANGFEIVSSTPLEFDRFIRAEYANWGKFVRERGIRGE
jgi:tripartite-type tricarboxylate transporter receptor subunit TctC